LAASSARWPKRLEPRRLAEARRSLDLISRQWDESLGKLKMFVEKAD
jgi:hypothetical protein